MVDSFLTKGRAIRACVTGLLVLGVSGCGITGLACDQFEAAGVEVSTYDAMTGETVIGTITAIASSGSYADTAVVLSDGSVQGSPIHLANERTGTYSVSVFAEGYQPWRMDNVVVIDEDRCHVRTVRLEARLVPV